MKTKFSMFRRGAVFYVEDTATGKQTSLRTKDETEATSLLNARNEASRQPILNLHLARAYLTASDPAFVERSWQTVMEQLQARGKESSRERYTSVFKSPSFDGLRHKKLLETTADDFLAVFKEGKVAITYFLKRLHNFTLSLGWIAKPIVAPCLWPKYKAKDRRGITREEHESVLAVEKKAEWKLFLELLWESVMPRQPKDAEAALEKLGDHLRAGWAKRHPVSTKTLESVREVVREKWELEQQTKRTAARTAPAPSKGKSRKPHEPER